MGPLVRCGYGHRDMDTDTFSLCPFDTATRPVVGLSNYSRTATRQELCRVHSEIGACGAGWVAVSVSAQVCSGTCLFQTVSVSMSVSTLHKWTRSFSLPIQDAWDRVDLFYVSGPTFPMKDIYQAFLHKFMTPFITGTLRSWL